MIKARTVLPCLVLLLSLGLFSSCSGVDGSGDTQPTVKVKIRLDTALIVDGQEEVPDGLFGISAYHGASMCLDKTGKKQVLFKESGLRWVGMPASINWHYPKTKPEKFGPGWSDTAAGKRSFIWGKNGYNIPLCINGWRKMGVEPMIYLRGLPSWAENTKNGKKLPPSVHPNVERDAVFNAEYLVRLHQLAPFTWVHIGNEPNANWWKYKMGGNNYTDYYIASAKAIKKRLPQVKIGGPVLCWPPAWSPNQKGKKSWYTWNTYTMPFIKRAGKLVDFYDFHLYNARDPLIGLEESQAVANAMFLQNGVPGKVMISEYGSMFRKDSPLDPLPVWRRRVKPWQDLVMGILDYAPNTVIGIQIFDAYAQCGGKHRFFNGDNPKDQDPWYHMTSTWAPLRGKRLATGSSNAKVKVYASVRNDGRIGVVIVNQGNEKAELNLDFAAKHKDLEFVEGRSIRFSQSIKPDMTETEYNNQGLQDKAGEVTMEIETEGKGEADSKGRFKYGKLAANDDIFRFSIDANETIGLMYRTKQPILGADKVRWQQSFFGDKVHQKLPKESGKVTFLVNFDEKTSIAASSAALFVGALGLIEKDQVSMWIDDTQQTLSAGWLQKIPLKKLPEKSPLAVSFRLDKRSPAAPAKQDLVISSVKLVFSGERAK